MENIFLDCGSNIGQSYEHFSKKYGDNYRYILFEPNPYCFNILQSKYNNTSNISILNKAVYTENKICPFFFCNDTDVGGSIIVNHNSNFYDITSKYKLNV